MPLEEAVAHFPDDAINARPPNVTYTPWHLLEHIRIAQHDILEYITNRAYLEPSWPEEYWPPLDATATPADLAATIEGFRADQRALRALVSDSATDLLAAIPGTPGHTILRADPPRGRSQCLPRRRVRDPPPGDGYLAARPGAVGGSPAAMNAPAGAGEARSYGAERLWHRRRRLVDPLSLEVVADGRTGPA